MLALLCSLSFGLKTPAQPQQSKLPTSAEARTGGGGTTPNSNVVIRTVQVSQKSPNYRFVLTRDPAADNAPQGRQRVGRIDIFKGSLTAVLQSIEVDGTDPNWFQSSFHTLDINFDGYLDFAVLYEVGGKYSRDSYWLFDPGSGRFITNALTTELRALMPRELTLDPRKKQIRISLFIGPCLKSFEIYRVKNGHLELMESEMHSPKEPVRCVVETRKRLGGEMVLVSKREQNH